MQRLALLGWPGLWGPLLMAALQALPAFLCSHLELVNHLNIYFTPDIALVTENMYFYAPIPVMKSHISVFS